MGWRVRLLRICLGARALAAPPLLALALSACHSPQKAAPTAAETAAAAEAAALAAKGALAGALDVSGSASGVSAASSASAARSASVAGGASGLPAEAAALTEPAPERPLARDTQAELLALIAPALAPPASPEAGEKVLEFLRRNVGPGSPSRINQGNAALARHAVDAAACRHGLEGVTLQTPEQRTFCGAENMVPLYRGGKASEARACIDVFEFPNVACELPYVWASPTQAKAMCETQGKRLCAQDEWVLACGGDPGGGPDRRYAYGDEFDLGACNTNKPAASFGGPLCDADTAADAFRTCRTNTEPSGAFPRCRSRFGAFDLHGNVAEIMARRDEDGRTVSQLKGSAFFYVDVARRPDEKLSPRRMRETYPDHCAHDPRWHVEPIGNAWHVNYHLGFRCCKTVSQRSEVPTARVRGGRGSKPPVRATRGAVRGEGARSNKHGGT